MTRSRRIALTLARWLAPTIILFAVLLFLAWKISRTAARPFVYDF